MSDTLAGLGREERQVYVLYFMDGPKPPAISGTWGCPYFNPVVGRYFPSYLPSAYVGQSTYFISPGAMVMLPSVEVGLLAISASSMWNPSATYPMWVFSRRPLGVGRDAGQEPRRIRAPGCGQR